MSFKNFVPTFWENEILRNNSKITVLAGLLNRKYEGKISNKGDTVKILGIGGVTVGDYTGSNISDPETAEDTSVSLVINHAPYFNVMVDDVDKRLAVGGLMNAIMQEANESLANKEDTDIGTELLNGGGTNIRAAASITSKLARYLILEGKTKLWNNGVKPTTTICAVVNPSFYEKLEIRAEELATENNKIIENGFSGKVSGVEIYVSNNLPKDSSNNDVMFMFTKGRAIAHAAQISKVEAYRPEKRFSDAVKGLSCYGTKVVRPKELFYIRASGYATNE